ncbi:MAG TPA: hypothetical protein VFP68_05265 [Burkholderiaceae bacterium]|nr:hypothetical protein [Burkholderiaceae bacterium]
MNAMSTCHVQADTALGPLRMRIPLPPHPRKVPGRFDNLDVAAAVARCEPLLCELERWLQTPLDPAPVHACLPAAAGVEMTLTDSSLAPPATTCRLPWAALRCRPLPQRLLGPQAQWPSMRGELELARYEAAPAARSALSVGAMLLLPQAFHPAWVVHLHCADENACIDAEHAMNDGNLRLLAPLHDALPAHAEWRVVLDISLDVPIPWALGWQACPLALPTRPGRARLIGPDAKPWVEGTIVPALQGAALWIERCCDDHEDAECIESAMACDFANA